VKKIVNPIRAEVIVPEITSKQSPWKIANALYNSSITFYILPDGRVLQGSDIPQVTNIPDGSKVLVAYREIAKPQTRFPVGEDLAAIYLAPQTLYLFPERTLRSGDQIEDFTKLPADLRVFAKMD
jgi:hypothetical protein